MSSTRALYLMAMLSLAGLAVIFAQGTPPNPANLLQFRAPLNKDNSRASSQQQSRSTFLDDAVPNSYVMDNKFMSDQQPRFNQWLPAPLNLGQTLAQIPISAFLSTVMKSTFPEHLNSQRDFNQLVDEYIEGPQVRYFSFPSGVTFVRTCSTDI